MRLIGSVQFDDDDTRTIVHALEGLSAIVDRGADAEPKRWPVRTFVSRVRQEDAFEYVQLNDIGSALDDLAVVLKEQSDSRWWRQQGAPGDDATVQGLADGRRNQLAGVQEVRALLVEAVALVNTVDRRVLRQERLAAVGA